jgi:3-oxoacyl-[acyl-carrier-protein] synthase-3
MLNHRAGILGTGHSYPEGILTNEDLAKVVETSDEWITTRTGIKQRRKAAPGEYTSLFAVRAARQAIERARLDPADIDLLLCATVTPDQILPSTGCIVQAELGAHNAAAMDIVAACSGFLYGVSMADSMIRTGQVRHAVVVGAEILTQYVDYTDRQTCLATARALPCWDQLRTAGEFWRARSGLTGDTKSSFIHPAAALAENRLPIHSPPAITSSR